MKRQFPKAEYVYHLCKRCEAKATGAFCHDMATATFVTYFAIKRLEEGKKLSLKKERLFMYLDALESFMVNGKTGPIRELLKGN